MNRKFWLLAVGTVLSGCDSSPRQSTIRPQAVAKPVLKPVATPTPKAKPTFIELHPEFQFVIKSLEVKRVTEEEKKEDRIFFNAHLGYKGPKPVWWGKRPQLSKLQFITDTGKTYEAADVRQGEDYFGAHGLCVLYTFALVPKLKKSERVLKAVAVFEIADSGLARITVDVPPKDQRN